MMTGGPQKIASAYLTTHPAIRTECSQTHTHPSTTLLPTDSKLSKTCKTLAVSRPLSQFQQHTDTRPIFPLPSSPTEDQEEGDTTMLSSQRQEPLRKTN